ncbi:transcriptional regulator [Streptomyces sp. 150FB]|uniref:LCP family protein n=1 Tax=Streptomyces sp. 150FB TaxID=1576605 RepID=UPI000589409F|nr:LCP family protein [Streptomyces sp. 150FB]KIF76720.1 transcriptional regulator [Streptomyces sp. 150FB]
MTDRRSRRLGGNGTRSRTPSRRRRVMFIVVWCLVGLVVLAGGGLGFVYFKLNGNLNGIDINAQLGNGRPKNVDNGSEDILVLGSDSRSGANAGYGGSAGGTARSDTAMIIHVYKGHKKASLVSVPRDTLVQRPACAGPKGKTVPARQEAMFNSAYEVGGPACTVKTVEKMSGIRMDHFIEVDFTGFKKLIDQLGGVKITTSKAIDDPKSHLKLAKGTHTLHGEQALGLVRTRKTVGDGSDLGRIQLQQAFVKALISQVKSVGVFSNPKKLYDLADSATKAITPDSGLDSVEKLIGFAGGLKELSAGNVRMITLPVRYDPADPNRVLPLRKASQQVWTALRQDRPIPASATKDSAGDKGTAHGVVTG